MGCDVECHKDSSVFLPSPIDFEVEWHNLHFEFIKKNKQIKNF